MKNKNEAENKAKELIEQFKKSTSYKYQEYAGANYSTFEHDIETLKECALIFVHEMIEELEDKKQFVDDNMLFDWNNEVIKSWQDVKYFLLNFK